MKTWESLKFQNIFLLIKFQAVGAGPGVRLEKCYFSHKLTLHSYGFLFKKIELGGSLCICSYLDLIEYVCMTFIYLNIYNMYKVSHIYIPDIYMYIYISYIYVYVHTYTYYTRNMFCIQLIGSSQLPSSIISNSVRLSHLRS